jgi:hypothetical protein
MLAVSVVICLVTFLVALFYFPLGSKGARIKRLKLQLLIIMIFSFALNACSSKKIDQEETTDVSDNEPVEEICYAAPEDME